MEENSSWKIEGATTFFGIVEKNKNIRRRNTIHSVYIYISYSVHRYILRGTTYVMYLLFVRTRLSHVHATMPPSPYPPPPYLSTHLGGDEGGGATHCSPRYFNTSTVSACFSSCNRSMYCGKEDSSIYTSNNHNFNNAKKNRGIGYRRRRRGTFKLYPRNTRAITSNERDKREIREDRGISGRGLSQAATSAVRVSHRAVIRNVRVPLIVAHRPLLYLYRVPSWTGGCAVRSAIIIPYHIIAWIFFFFLHGFCSKRLSN